MKTDNASGSLIIKAEKGIYVMKIEGRSYKIIGF
jgi:hypothetical protein